VVCLAPHPAPPAVDRILVIHLGALGDVVRALPAVSSLRAAYAGAHLAWLVEPAAATALVGQPWIDEVLVLPRAALRGAPRVARRLARFARALRARRFELVLDFQSVARSALLGLVSGAPRRVSYARPLARELSWLVANDRAELSPARASRFARSQALVRHLGIEAEPSERPFALDPAACARMAAALGGGAAPVALHAGASSAAPGGRYGAAGYAAVARALRDRCGAHSIATWGPAPGDRAAAEALVAASGGAARLAPETPSVADLAALLAACRLFIGTDAGPLHVASLVHTPVVQILGPGDPLEDAPWPRTPSRSVGGPGREVRAVSPESVVDAALELLLTGPSRS
jgi:ADP-heptose:LPS heptosyltransferase